MNRDTIQQWVLLVVLGLTTAQGSSNYGIGICDQPWTAVYVHGVDGWDVTGSLLTLHKHVEGAFLYKVEFSTAENFITLPLEEFHVRGPHICGTNSWLLSDNETLFGQDTQWMPLAVCTNGEVHQANYSASQWSHDVSSQPVPIVGVVRWFTKPMGCGHNTVFSHFSDGSHLSGSSSQLVQFAKTSGLKVNMRDRGYSFLAQNTKVFGDRIVTAQSLNHLSLTPYYRGLKFNDNPFYKWHAVWTSQGKRDISRWKLNGTSPHGHENDEVALDWFGDDCWRRVYSTDGTGKVTFGSLEELIFMIRLGHEVRIHVDGYTLKATSLHVTDGDVIALTTDEFARRGGYPRPDAPFFNTNARVVYRLVHSSGKMKMYKFMIEDYTLSENVHITEAIDWLVDTRPWVKVHATPSNVQSAESSQSLNSSIANGASVRICLEMDTVHGQLFLQTESVRRNRIDDMITVQSLKNVKTQILSNSKDFSIPLKVSQLSFLINADGSVGVWEMRLSSRLTVSEDLYTNVNSTWFVNE